MQITNPQSSTCQLFHIGRIQIQIKLHKHYFSWNSGAATEDYNPNRLYFVPELVMKTWWHTITIQK